MSEQGRVRGPRGMYTRAFTRAEEEAREPASVPVPHVEPARVPRRQPRRRATPRSPRMASRPLELRGAVTIAAVLILGGLLAPLAISNDHDDPESMLAADPAAASGDIELPPQDGGPATPPAAVAAVASTRELPRSPEPRARARNPEPGARSRADGGLVVESQPAGARVMVNGIGYGETPLKIGYLPFGTKRVRIVKEGYASVERTVRLDAGSPRPRLRVTLRQQK